MYDRKGRSPWGLTRSAPNVSIANGERITLGNRCHVGERVCLWAGNATGRITLGDDVMIGPATFVTASDYGLEEGTPPAFQPKNERDVVIGSGVWIGANAVITVGRHDRRRLHRRRWIGGNARPPGKYDLRRRTCPADQTPPETRRIAWLSTTPRRRRSPHRLV